MGIRFLCQHCRHRLNVKSAQSGQVGDCPNCGSSITVPEKSAAAPLEPVTVTQSEFGDLVLDVDNQITEAGLSPVIAFEPDSKPQPFSVPEASPVSTHHAQRARQFSKGPDEPESATPFLLDKPLPPSTMGKIDPIEEAPRKVWYYRSKELGEKGPLKSKQMQTELNTGNVTIGCIVWREDWEDWQAAEKVFPSLVALLEAQQPNASNRNSTGLIPDEFNPHSPLRRRQRNRWMLGVGAIVLGLLAIGGLVYYASPFFAR